MIPTVVSAEPSKLWSGGQWVRITGTGFRLPAEPGPSTGPLPAPLPTVKVLFGTEEASNVRVFSATELECTAPAHDEGATGVTVTNLDDAGVPVAGESVTRAAFVTFARPALTDTADFTRVTEELVTKLRQQVLANVVITTAVDYDVNTGSTFDMIDLATQPAVVVTGPRCVEDRLYDPYVRYEGADGSKTRRYHQWPTYDLYYQIVAVTNKTKAANNLLAILAAWVDQNVYLRVTRVEGGTEYVEYRADKSEDPQVILTPGNSDLRAAQIGYVVRGVQLQDLPGLPGSSVLDSDYSADDLEVTVAGV